MVKFKKRLAPAGVPTFSTTLFQALIGFSPSLRLYFGAPDMLVKNHVSLFLSI